MRNKMRIIIEGPPQSGKTFFCNKIVKLLEAEGIKDATPKLDSRKGANIFPHFDSIEFTTEI